MLMTTPFAGITRIRFKGLRRSALSAPRRSPVVWICQCERTPRRSVRPIHSMNGEFVAPVWENASFLGVFVGRGVACSGHGWIAGEVAGEVGGEVSKLVADEVAGGDVVDGHP